MNTNTNELTEHSLAIQKFLDAREEFKSLQSEFQFLIRKMLKQSFLLSVEYGEEPKYELRPFTKGVVADIEPIYVDEERFDEDDEDTQRTLIWLLTNKVVDIDELEEAFDAVAERAYMLVANIQYFMAASLTSMKNGLMFDPLPTDEES